jgi:hypothetical protein
MNAQNVEHVQDLEHRSRPLAGMCQVKIGRPYTSFSFNILSKWRYQPLKDPSLFESAQELLDSTFISMIYLMAGYEVS